MRLAVVLLFLLSSSALAQPLSRARLTELAAAQLPQAFTEFREFLRIPNDAHHPADLEKAIAWMEHAFERDGFTTRRLPTAGIPLLLAERPVKNPAGTVLIYLQSDGQPVDPSQWNQPSPWEPVLRERSDGTWRDIPWDRLAGSLDPDWRVFARSTADSKANIVTFLAAMRAIRDAGVEPDYNIKVIIDTEEELGSPNLPAAVEQHRDTLAADMLIIFDGPRHSSNRPSLTYGARGIVDVVLTTYGPREPQHSGRVGNYVPNPALRLAQLLASMKDADGRVTIPGWYDGVTLDAATREQLARVPHDDEAFRRMVGFAAPDKVGATLQEAIQYPSLNIVGMQSAWIGDQARTIIPATATANLDIRLVKESDPDRLVSLVRDHIEGLGYHVLNREPTDAERLTSPRLATLTSKFFYGAFRTDMDSRVGRWLVKAYTRAFGEEPIQVRTGGGSIPIAPFVETLGIPAVSCGTANPDNNQHSPNENLRLGNFTGGLEMMIAVLSEPLRQPPG
jgi:acetylornithine deacetylase/succinyl-diaminopimelate desuccinylase-like protein